MSIFLEDDNLKEEDIKKWKTSILNKELDNILLPWPVKLEESKKKLNEKIRKGTKRKKSVSVGN